MIGKRGGLASGPVERRILWFGLCGAVPVIALLAATVTTQPLRAPTTASRVPTQTWQTILVEHSKGRAELVTTTQAFTRIVIEASGSAVKTEWSGVCLPIAGTLTRPEAGTTTTKPGTTSAVLPIQLVRVPATKTGKLLVTCSIAAYAVMMGRGHLTIKVQVLAPGVGSL
jgi:hypothetical protein